MGTVSTCSHPTCSCSHDKGTSSCHHIDANFCENSQRPDHLPRIVPSVWMDTQVPLKSSKARQLHFYLSSGQRRGSVIELLFGMKVPGSFSSPKDQVADDVKDLS